MRFDLFGRGGTCPNCAAQPDALCPECGAVGLPTHVDHLCRACLCRELCGPEDPAAFANRLNQLVLRGVGKETS